jgi:DNA invertase Pin-like site-specific DNA recombinase
VVYAAKSTEDRRGSIPDQLLDCRSAIDQAGGREVVEEYVDEAFSAYRRSRGPGLADAMEHAEDLVQQFGAAELWAQHSDRLARGDGRVARHAVEIGLWALKQDVVVRTVQDPDTFRDLLYAVVTGQRNHEDSRRRGAAMTAGRRRAVARGDFIGWRPDGYKLEVELDGARVRKRMVIDPARREAIKLIFEMALDGRPTGAIARELNDRGWLTNPRRKDVAPRRWRVAQVDAVLRNRRYAGVAMFAGEVLARGHWPAYITESEHDAIRARLAKSTRNRKSVRVETYLLAGLLRCGACGQRLYCTAGNKRNDGTRARRYVCSSHDKDRDVERCSAKRLGADMLEAMFVASLRSLLDEECGETEMTIVPDPTSIFDLSGEREQLRKAVSADDDAAFQAAFESLLGRIGPQAAAWDQAGISRRRTRQLESVERFEAWAEEEARGRTDISRAEAPRLGQLLHTWFAEASVFSDERTIKITVKHRAPSECAPAGQNEAELDRISWTRVACETGKQRLRFHAWDDAEIIAALQAWAAAHGHSPTWSDWGIAEADHPNGRTVKRHFGSWSEALREAGLAPYVPSSCPRNYAWSDAEVIEALQAWASRNGRPPRWGDWRRATDERPCNQTVVDHFGAWRKGLALAGLG